MHSTAARVIVISDDESMHTMARWTAGRAEVGAPIERFATSADARDALTLRIRDGALPYLIFLDVRRNIVAGMQLLRWVAQHDPVARVLMVALAAGASHTGMLHGLGADAVTTTFPAAAKFRQLYGIASELSQLPKRTRDRSLAREAVRTWQLEQQNQQAKN